VAVFPQHLQGKPLRLPAVELEHMQKDISHPVFPVSR
jgi:hypothetical protein